MWAQPDSDSQVSTKSLLEDTYDTQEIGKFLQMMKNMKKVKLEEYFAEKEILLYSLRIQMSRGKGAFTDQEIFRLKKIVLRLKS